MPYRKDDLTSSYAETYERLRDEFDFAVCRVDVRGTGSSQGDATDEYPEAEQSDLAEVIAWLAEQDWCNGSVGMFGTSYSGFDSLQMAVEQPPALKAICAIYATDDRWTDDVHWRGGALRMVDLVDYRHYMTPMVMLPPVPAVWGDDWREEWRRRIETSEPWVLTWLRQNRHGPYWDHGSVRLGGTTDGYDRIDCAVLIVAGWADGYRNNSFRTAEALAAAGVPHRLLAGPWAHAGPATAMPGPRHRPRRRDGRLVRPMAARPGRRRAPRPCRRLRARLHPARAGSRHARGVLDQRAMALPRGGTTHAAAPGSSAASSSSPTSGRPPGSTAPATCRGACRPTSAPTTPVR